MRGFVPQAGIEPARALRPTGFSYYYGFHHPTPVCSLDYAFTISFDLGAPCLVSTRSLSGFARYSHLKGFAEFTEFYIFNFSKCTQILFIQRTMSKSCVSTSSTTKASIQRLKKKPEPKFGILSERPGSNRPPRPWQGRALPNELLSLIQELFLGVQK